MAAAYAAFGNGGYYIKPYTVNKIVYRQDGSEETFNTTKTRAMADSTAWMITDMLRSGIDNGNIALNKINGVQYAAKTGTSNFDDKTKALKGLPDNSLNDLWVVGFDQQYSIGVWYGYDITDSSHYFTTRNWNDRRQIWSAVASGIFEKTGNTFQPPDSVVQVTVVQGSDPLKLANEYTPDYLKVTDWFKKGTEPTESSSEYMQIPDVSNLSVKESNGTATLSWTAPYLPETNGLPTYHVYEQVDGNTKEIGTTDATSYKVSVTNGKKYTFTIKVSYSNLGDMLSNGATAILDLSAVKPEEKSKVTVSLAGDEVIKLTLGNKFVDPGIIVKEGNKDVTSKATWKAEASASDGWNNVEGRVTITYTIIYNNQKYTLKRTVIVERDDSGDSTSSDDDSET